MANVKPGQMGRQSRLKTQASSFDCAGIGTGAMGEMQEDVALYEREGLTEVGKKGSE
jgi:hypothetical protein